MIEAIINNFVNSFVRDLEMSTRVFLSIIFFGIALLTFKKSINQSSDLRPIRLGFAILFMISMILSVVYLVL